VLGPRRAVTEQQPQLRFLGRRPATLATGRDLLRVCATLRGVRARLTRMGVLHDASTRPASSRSSLPALLAGSPPLDQMEKPDYWRRESELDAAYAGAWSERRSFASRFLRFIPAFGAGIVENMRRLKTDEATIRARERESLGVPIGRPARVRVIENNLLVPPVPVFLAAERAREPRSAACEEVEDPLSTLRQPRREYRFAA